MDEVVVVGYGLSLIHIYPDFGEMAGLAEPMLKAFPEIIESTTKVEIGLNLSLIHIYRFET